MRRTQTWSGSASIGLIAAPRTADALQATVWIAPVLRSQDDRFGTRLLNVGPGTEIRLFVPRPPATRDGAQRIAAEHYVFADECGRSDIGTITTALVNAPIWQFWWD